jgi:hypothetical protein
LGLRGPRRDADLPPRRRSALLRALPGARDPVLYKHLAYSEFLRKVLRSPQDTIPTDLDEREIDQLIMDICYQRRERPEWCAYLWKVLQQATGTTKSLHELFGNYGDRVPADVMRDLGRR